jgi:glycosyltransferase involved in cell wall biosynthesis
MSSGPILDVPVGHGDRPRLALVLWNGNVGGAEVFSLSLAHHMRQLGTDVTLVFIESPEPLAARFPDKGVPYRSLGFRRGRDVLRYPRRYAAEVARVGPDGALLVTCGYMGAALRAGGYRKSIVAVEHGDILEAKFYSRRQRALRWIGRVSGSWADDIEVAVSDFILERLQRQPHTHTIPRIYNAIDPDQYVTGDAHVDRIGDAECTVAFAGRLVYGKGPDYLIEAVAQISSAQRMRLLIAGDGPERSRLEALAVSLGVGHLVDFLGLRHDMPTFWEMCDIAVVPSAEFIESCPMTTLEAMATGKPVVATRNGGLQELVIDGETGILVPSHDKTALAQALLLYAGDKQLQVSHGASGRARVREYFNINKCARAYLELFDALAKD